MKFQNANLGKTEAPQIFSLRNKNLTFQTFQICIFLFFSTTFLGAAVMGGIPNGTDCTRAFFLLVLCFVWLVLLVGLLAWWFKPIRFSLVFSFTVFSTPDFRWCQHMFHWPLLLVAGDLVSSFGFLFASLAGELEKSLKVSCLHCLSTVRAKLPPSPLLCLYIFLWFPSSS